MGAKTDDGRRSGPIYRPLPGMAWPLVLTGHAAALEVLQHQFRTSERADPAAVRVRQMAQIAELAAHAHDHSAFWRARLDAAGYARGSPTERWFAALPILDRPQAKAVGSALAAMPVPAGHGEIFTLKTSGSTGTPLEIAKTGLSDLFWQAIGLRDSLWHSRDLSGKLAAIRVGAAAGQSPVWGPAYAGYATGPAVTFDARQTVDAQIDWLMEQRPQYLLSHASNLHALAVRCLARGERLTGLIEVRSFSERMPDDLAEMVHAAWEVPLVDIYSANEVGYIALQCERGCYHVQAEDVLIEIIDAAGQICAAGEIGRVVATSLHNFATPLLRYDLGDFATLGSDCLCGRTLPVLERILGRKRNMLRLPGGESVWPGFPMNMLTRLDAIEAVRMVQHDFDTIEVQMVLSRALTAAEEAALADAVRVRLGHPFAIRLTRVTAIERGPGGKMEDFLCLMD